MRDVPDLSQETLLQCQIILASDMRWVVYHAMGAAGPGDAFEKRWAARTVGLEHFRTRNWRSCINYLEPVVARYPDDLSLMRLLELAKVRDQGR